MSNDGKSRWKTILCIAVISILIFIGIDTDFGTVLILVILFAPSVLVIFAMFKSGAEAGSTGSTCKKQNPAKYNHSPSSPSYKPVQTGFFGNNKETYTEKQDFWGNTIVVDSKGREIGRKQNLPFTGYGIYDKQGHKIADIEKDYNENENIVFE